MELVRNYAEAYDKRIIEELYELARELDKPGKQQKGRASFWPSLALRRRSCERQGTFVQTLYWILIVLFAFLSQTANAQTADCTLFVSANNGSDNNDGLSLGSSFKTIQNAAWVVNPGDVVCVDDGVYTDEYFGTISEKTGSGNAIVGLKRGGTGQRPIIFRSISKWGAILDGQNNATHVCWSIGEDDPNIINPIGYVRIENFELRGCNGGGFNIGGWSMASKVHDLTLYGNHIHNMGRQLYASFYGRGIGIGASDFVDNMTIDSNVLHHLGRLKHTTVDNCQNVTGPDIEGLGGWHACHDYRHDHGLSLGGYYRGGDNYTIVNNIFYEIDSGVPIGAWGGDNWKIVNNTFYTKNDSDGLSSQIFAAYSSFGQNNWLIANNLMYNLGDGVWPCIQDREEARSGWTITNNLCYGAPLTDFTAGATLSNNTTGEDPLFLNAQQYDFRLGQGSPAIDAGIPIPGINDNFSGTAPDIGACEFGSSTCPSGGGASIPSESVRRQADAIDG